MARLLARKSLSRLPLVPIAGISPETVRKLALEQRTRRLAAVAIGSSVVAIALQVGRVWKRGSAPLPAETDGSVMLAGAQAVGETVHVAVEGYKGSTNHEITMLNMLLSLSGTWLFARASTTLIRRYGKAGPFRNLVVSGTHVHHFVPGILLAFGSGGLGLLARGDRTARYLAIPFGAGMALTLDESALLLKLDDVYWSDDGAISVHVTLASIALLATSLSIARLLRRGEQVVLGENSD